MRRWVLFILFVLLFVPLQAQSLDDIIADIYAQLSETEDVDYEDLLSELMDQASNPINLNSAVYEDLARLRFLSDSQIDAILLYVHKHPMAEMYELQLLPGFRDYEIRNLSYFVRVEPVEKQDKLYFREVFHYAKHEITLRADARNMENYTTDPFYAQLRYRFNYKNRVQFGLNLKRPTGAPFREMEYGTYLQLNNIGHLKTFVAGNFQGQFGMGLVLGQPFHMGKSVYLLSTANGTEGVRKFSSASSSFDYLHGAAATFRLGMVDVTALYSLRQENDTLWHHLVGANATLTHNRFRLGFTALENIWAPDSAQACFGLNARFNAGRMDFSGEIAASQASEWGFAGSFTACFTPVDGLGIMALYRYYSTEYRNRYAYGFSETSKISDENGFYVGFDVNLLRQWRFMLYADGFRFAGTKFGIPYPSSGYDILTRVSYFTSPEISMNWKLRARSKAQKDTYGLCYQLLYESGGWRLKTQLDANLVVRDTTVYSVADNPRLTWGASIIQDVQYTFPSVPLTLQFRIQAFDILNWDNRVYAYENDVLYAFSVPATYGRGGRAYLNLRWKVLDQLSIYCRLSETLTASPSSSSSAQNLLSRTDVHLLLRINL